MTTLKLSQITKLATDRNTGNIFTSRLTDWLEFNGTHSTVRLYRAFKIYSVVKTLIRQVNQNYTANIHAKYKTKIIQKCSNRVELHPK